VNNITPATNYFYEISVENTPVITVGPGAGSGWFLSSGPAIATSWGSLDLAGQNVPSVLTTANSTTGTIEAFKRGGVPDIAQKSNECGPTSTADSLRWLAAQHPLLDPGGAMPASDDDLIK